MHIPRFQRCRSGTCDPSNGCFFLGRCAALCDHVIRNGHTFDKVGPIVKRCSDAPKQAEARGLPGKVVSVHSHGRAPEDAAVGRRDAPHDRDRFVFEHWILAREIDPAVDGHRHLHDAAVVQVGPLHDLDDLRVVVWREGRVPRRGALELGGVDRQQGHVARKGRGERRRGDGTRRGGFFLHEADVEVAIEPHNARCHGHLVLLVLHAFRDHDFYLIDQGQPLQGRSHFFRGGERAEEASGAHARLASRGVRRVSERKVARQLRGSGIRVHHGISHFVGAWRQSSVLLALEGESGLQPTVEAGPRDVNEEVVSSVLFDHEAVPSDGFQGLHHLGRPGAIFAGERGPLEPIEENPDSIGSRRRRDSEHGVRGAPPRFGDPHGRAAAAEDGAGRRGIRGQRRHVPGVLQAVEGHVPLEGAAARRVRVQAGRGHLHPPDPGERLERGPHGGVGRVVGDRPGPGAGGAARRRPAVVVRAQREPEGARQPRRPPPRQRARRRRVLPPQPDGAAAGRHHVQGRAVEGLVLRERDVPPIGPAREGPGPLDAKAVRQQPRQRVPQAGGGLVVAEPPRVPRERVGGGPARRDEAKAATPVVVGEVGLPGGPADVHLLDVVLHGRRYCLNFRAGGHGEHAHPLHLVDPAEVGSHAGDLGHVVVGRLHHLLPEAADDLVRVLEGAAPDAHPRAPDHDARGGLQGGEGELVVVTVRRRRAGEDVALPDDGDVHRHPRAVIVGRPRRGDARDVVPFRPDLRGGGDVGPELAQRARGTVHDGAVADAPDADARAPRRRTVLGLQQEGLSVLLGEVDEHPGRHGVVPAIAGDPQGHPRAARVLHGRGGAGERRGPGHGGRDDGAVDDADGVREGALERERLLRRGACSGTSAHPRAVVGGLQRREAQVAVRGLPPRPVVEAQPGLRGDVPAGRRAHRRGRGAADGVGHRHGARRRRRRSEEPPFFPRRRRPPSSATASGGRGIRHHDIHIHIHIHIHPRLAGPQEENPNHRGDDTAPLHVVGAETAMHPAGDAAASGGGGALRR